MTYHLLSSSLLSSFHYLPSCHLSLFSPFFSPFFCLLLSSVGKNFLRLSSPRGQQSHCLQASDAFNKQQWINCIRLAKEAAILDVEPPEAGPTAKEGLEPIEDIQAEAELEGVDYGSREEKQEEEEDESCEERERRVGTGLSSSHSEEEVMEEDPAPLQEEEGQASDHPEEHAPQPI